MQFPLWAARVETVGVWLTLPLAKGSFVSMWENKSVVYQMKNPICIEGSLIALHLWIIHFIWDNSPYGCCTWVCAQGYLRLAGTCGFICKLVGCRQAAVAASLLCPLLVLPPHGDVNSVNGRIQGWQNVCNQQMSSPWQRSALALNLH